MTSLPTCNMKEQEEHTSNLQNSSSIVLAVLKVFQIQMQLMKIDSVASHHLMWKAHKNPYRSRISSPKISGKETDSFQLCPCTI